jgi:hypothetical protein
MADPRRNRSANRPARPAAPLTGEITVDDETASALAMFNARLAQQADAERAQRRVDKATREKDQAAAHVRALENDPKAGAEQRAEAAAAYKVALETLERVKKGEPEPAPVEQAEAPAEDATPDADDQPDAVEPPDAALDETPAADR